MRIQSSTTLTHDDVISACSVARNQGHDIWIDELLVGKRGGITVYCNSHTGNRACNGRSGMAASWSAWGSFIADLFARDPEAVIGGYKGIEDFVKQCRNQAKYNGHSIDFLNQLPRASAAAA
jgi:hypothetical protein